ncbi:uncharacterized protein LOC129924532 isoform X1 [Biomphalaria glabrata]|uniref:Uncharacterized protein LOC129924532 isoform X1 n=2 Tax=Biomphalaria glabrata TaxID=6526 RepID=A0A9W2ZLC7_BIOGL|nr:uncharacterized protein LOC129924532 isoform X1 [Biomphalaria glabrata]
MRPAKQVKAVRGQLEVLEDFKVQIEGLLGNIVHVIKVGESWIGESDNQTFTDIYQFLAIQTAECISKCSSISNGSEDACQSAGMTVPNVKENTPVTVPDFTSQDDQKLIKLLLRIESMETSLTENLKRMKSLNQKFKEHERNTKESISKAQEETENSNAKKYEKIIEELHAASSFMSHLQKETESLSQQINERVLTGSHEPNTLVEFHELKLEISKNTESLSNIKSLYDTLSSQVNENGKIISDLCISLEEKNMLNSQGKSTQITTENCKHWEDNTTSQIDYTKNKDDFLDHEEFSSLVCQAPELQKISSIENMCFIPSGKEVTGSSVSATTLKTSMDEKDIVDKGYDEKINKLSEAIAEMNQHVSFYVFVANERTLNLRAERNFTCFDAGNDGNHFNVVTGTFTVPCSGLYLFSLMLDIDSHEEMEFKIFVKSKNEEELCFTYLKKINDSTTVVFALTLCKDDEIYIRPFENYFKVNVCVQSYFSCALLKTF